MAQGILDSNIIIYSIQLNQSALRNYLANYSLYASQISKVEVLGYHLITAQDKLDLEILFQNLSILDVSNNIIQKAIDLKQSQKMTLGDSLIAATSIVYQIPLLTRNTEDFKNISTLTIINPFDFI
ncbi:MAG: type II toxin-antitoxin system VapC family toxin [Microscillaceae bacterium]|nr:type II toxin-antitoxin system VapC family toxin [Microscillaceae bacterium]